MGASTMSYRNIIFFMDVWHCAIMLDFSGIVKTKRITPVERKGNFPPPTLRSNPPPSAQTPFCFGEFYGEAVIFA